jgi:type VI secretion system secreted protein VgrG
MPTQLEVTASLTYSQTGRAIRVETPLGPDMLLLESFEGEDEIAGGFCYTLSMLGKDPSLSPAKMMRMPVKVKMTLSDGGTRVINGMISKFRTKELAEGLTVYEAEIRPWWWFYSLTEDFRIFQNQSIPDIVKAVLKGGPLSFKCIKPHPPHEYRVQYGESHLDFVQRLMEEEGIFWFAEHTDDQCTLVVADDNSAIKPVVKLRMSTVAHDTEDEFVLGSFFTEQNVRVGQYTATDYNFETPSTTLLSHVSGKDASEVFEFPGGFETKDDGTRLSRLRHEEILAEQVEAEGVGRCRAVRVGARVEISKHSNASANGTYLVTSVKEVANLGDFRSAGDPGFSYHTTFTATPVDTPYRPERSTPQPRAVGYETAVVVGPAGEEIFTDKYGRVKVQFFWDRQGKKDDKSSCWMRVSTAWAGKGWGAIHTPRIGQEVLVAFLNGDPEDPIIIGRLWNAEQMPPYSLPSNKTQSGIKSRSTLQGSPDNFNEIRFEDKKGSEEVYIHAEKDKKIVVENNNTENIGNDEKIVVGSNQTISVGKDQSLTVGAEQSISVGKNRTDSIGGGETLSIGKDQTITIGGAQSETVAKDVTVAISGSRKATIEKDVSDEIAGNLALTVSKDAAVTVSKNYGVTVDKKVTIKAGDMLTIESDKEVLIKTGDASIHMKKNGDIEIKGAKIQVNASGDLVLKGSKIAAN